MAINTSKKYFAFISYKREDEEWAKWLQHKLEHYKLPSNLNGRSDLPKEIRPIFRDKSDLAGGVLAEEINDALENSQYLIVICSPRAAQSEWVSKEVQSFIAKGRVDRIIPFIVGGEAHASKPEDECFPVALQELPAEQELLGVNINEMGRDAAAVKVVAQMFGLKFDELWQRWEREQRKRRNWIIVASVLAVLVMAGIAFWMYVQRQLTLKAYTDLKISNTMVLSKNAIRDMESGNYSNAYNILKGLCSDNDIEKLSGIPELERALRTLYRESTSEGVSLITTIGNIGRISEARFSDNNNSIYVLVDDKEIREYAIDGEFKKNVFTTEVKDISDFNVDSGKVLLTNEDGDTLYLKNIATNQDLITPVAGGDIYGFLSPTSDYLVYGFTDENENELWYLIDIKNQTKVFLYEDDYSWPYHIPTFSADEEKLIIIDKGHPVIYNVNKKTIETVLPDINSKFKTIKFSNNKDDLILYSWTDTLFKKHIQVFSLDIFDFVSFKDDICKTNTILETNINFYGDVIACCSDNVLEVYKTGLLPYIKFFKSNGHQCYIELLDKYYMENRFDFRSIVFSNKDDKVLLYDNDRIRIFDLFTLDYYQKHAILFDYISSSGNGFIEESDTLWFYEYNNAQIIGDTVMLGINDYEYKLSRDFIISNDNNIILILTDEKTIVYNRKTRKRHDIPIKTNIHSKTCMDYAGKYIGISSHVSSLAIYQTGNGDIIAKNDNMEPVTAFCFSPNAENLVVGYKDLCIYDPKTLKLKLRLPHEHKATILCVNYSLDGTLILSCSRDGCICLWDAQNYMLLKKLYIVEQPRSCSISPTNRYISVSCYNNNTYIWNLDNEQIVETIKDVSSCEFCQRIPDQMIISKNNYNYQYFEFPSLDKIINSINDDEIDKISAIKINPVRLKQFLYKDFVFR